MRDALFWVKWTVSVSACFYFINIFIISLLRYLNNQPGYCAKASIVIPRNSINNQHGGIDSDMLCDIWVSLQLCLDLRHPFSVSLCPGCSIQHVWCHACSVQTHCVDAVSSYMYSSGYKHGRIGVATETCVMQQTWLFSNIWKKVSAEGNFLFSARLLLFWIIDKFKAAVTNILSFLKRC